MRDKKLILGYSASRGASPPCSPMIWKDTSPPGSTCSFWTCTFGREKWERHSSIDRDEPGATGDPSTGWWSLSVVPVLYRIPGNRVYQQPQPAVRWGLCSSPCQHWDSSQVTLPISASRALKSSVLKVNYVYHKLGSVNSDLHFKTLLLLLMDIHVTESQNKLGWRRPLRWLNPTYECRLVNWHWVSHPVFF